MRYSNKYDTEGLSYAIILIIFLILVGIARIGWVPDYSDGDRTGIVTKLSYKGLVIKSWEGTILQGGMVKHTDSEGHTSMVPNVTDFSVTDPSIVKQLQHAMQTNSTVTIHYNEWLARPYNIDTSYVVNKVSLH